MKIKQLLIAACIGTMFTACSSDDTAPQNAERVPINFTANIQQLIPSVSTRVSNGTSGLSFTEFADGSEITVGFTDTGGDAINIKKTDGTWDYTGTKLYYSLTGASKTVVGIYPKQTTSIGGLFHSSYTTPTNQSELANYQKADIMGASAAISNPSSDPVTLNFKHLGAKIVVKMTGSSIPSTFSVKMNNIKTSGIYSASGSNVYIGYATGNSSVTFGNYIAAGQTAIIIPQEVAASTALFEVGTGDVTYTYTTTDAINFKAGYEYTFNLTFSQTAINLSDVSITDWSADPDKSDPILGDLVK